MSQRYFLLNTSIASGDDSELRAAAKSGEATVVEVAETNSHIPLPWIACFRPDDLRSCKLNWEPDQLDVVAPVIELRKAISNLQESLPLFEKITGESVYSKEYWQQAMFQITRLQLPYVVLDWSEMLMNMDVQEFTDMARIVFSQSDEALSVMKKHLLEYNADYLPYKHREFTDGKEITDNNRRVNTIAIHGQFIHPTFGNFREERWRLDAISSRPSSTMRNT